MKKLLSLALLFTCFSTSIMAGTEILCNINNGPFLIDIKVDQDVVPGIYTEHVYDSTVLFGGPRLDQEIGAKLEVKSIATRSSNSGTEYYIKFNKDSYILIEDWQTQVLINNDETISGGISIGFSGYYLKNGVNSKLTCKFIH